MIVRPAREADVPAWAAMRRRLWPDEDPVELERELPGAPGTLGLVAEEEGRLIAFAEAAVRNYAEGAIGPAAYLEGIWVDPEHRRRGVARALLAAVEQWGLDQGLGHLGSDALLDNEVSHRWHAAAGFAEVERLVVFGKPIG
jgi:aminoglycoside 6'-N-acetyltransferase I